MAPPKAAAAMVVAFILAIIAAFMTRQTPVESHFAFLPGHTSAYSHGSSSCGTTTRVDPISVVFYGEATSSNVTQHADHHGWTNHSAGTQYFEDHGCFAMDGTNASACSTCDRFHMRWRWNWDDNWRYYTMSTPHFERFGTCGHYVTGNSAEPPGGFVRAKWEIGYLWHNWNNGGGTHYFAGSQWYGNRQLMSQCNGQQAGNDGWVDFVEIANSFKPSSVTSVAASFNFFGDPNLILFCWNPSSGATYYQFLFLRWNGGQPDWLPVRQVATGNLSQCGGGVGAADRAWIADAYHLAVRACNNNACSNWSDVTTPNQFWTWLPCYDQYGYSCSGGGAPSSNPHNHFPDGYEW